ncbi:MAG: formate dehydrogenase [Peptococcaceae bacterium BICA1-8]|nr:MAG: formate dehydrogenase [Peptococcaceae bacterium BICA1-8]
MEIKRSVCPYDCPDTCGLLIEVVNKKAVKVKGDPEHPYTRGTLCPKMVHYEKTVYSPERLTQPLLQKGPKGSDNFEPITWDAAIQIIKERWQHIIAEYGAEAILPYSYAGTMGIVQRNCGEAFFYRLGASCLERTICSSSKGYGWSAVMGSTLVPHPNEALDSDLIILWGTNAMATNIHFLQNVRAAKKKGAKVWLIETYETPTAKVSDQVTLVKPGSDGALALGMMHVIVRDGLTNEQFINEHVQGFSEFKKVLHEYTPEKMSRLTGLKVDVIEELAHLYAKARAPFISLGTGLSRYCNGAMTVRSITCLPALVGAWAKPGGGLMANISTSTAFDTSKVTREDLLKETTRIINMNQLGDALNKTVNPPLMSLFVYHSNPVAVTPDQNMVIKGLLREDLFTVVHERFMTDTALYADLILPATTSLEQPDIYRSYGHYCVQKADAVIEALGEAKSNWEVFALLAQVLGFDEPYFNQTAEEMIKQLLESPTPWLAQVDLEKLSAGYPVELPLPENYKTKFKTPSGKIEIYNNKEEDLLPKYLKPHGDDAPYWFVNSPSIFSLNSSFNEQNELVEKKEKMYLLMHPVDAQVKGFSDGELVSAFNERGKVAFVLKITPLVPSGVVVSEGVFWLRDCPSDSSVNALTSQRLTDRAQGSTFYDTKVDVRSINNI